MACCSPFVIMGPSDKQESACCHYAVLITDLSPSYISEGVCPQDGLAGPGGW